MGGRHLEPGIMDLLIRPIASLFFKALGTFFAIMPSRIRIRLGQFIGFFLRLLQLRSAVIQQNLELAYPDDPALRKSLYKKAYTHLGNLGLEFFLVFGPMKFFVK